MKDLNNQPIIILGGFLINPKSYFPMSYWLKHHTKASVEIINVSKVEWLLTSWDFGWARILDKVHSSVIKFKKISKTGKVSLIGHSSGGVMLRLFLADNKFHNRIYNGKTICNNLITLGSPHSAIRATRLRSMVDKKYPGSFYHPEVNYASIAGRLNIDGPNSSRLSKNLAVRSYKSILGKSNLVGDGLVPIDSALLRNSRQIILDETSHGSSFGSYWYGSSNNVSKWWKLLESQIL
tara:strand:+ start:799 stop:1509 length:711 start_codon:yes stop_codon:yes gene_type:complete